MTRDRTLAGLIDMALERHQVWSGADLERIARGRGYALHATTINHIRAGTYRYRPSKTTLEAIAWLADVSREVAYEASDLPAPGKPFTDEIPDGADYLTPEERDVVVRLIRVFLKRGLPPDGAGNTHE